MKGFIKYILISSLYFNHDVLLWCLISMKIIKKVIGNFIFKRNQQITIHQLLALLLFGATILQKSFRKVF